MKSTVRSSLPSEARLSNSPAIFKRRLKTTLFLLYFNSDGVVSS